MPYNSLQVCLDATHIQGKEKAGIKIEMYCLELNTLNFPKLVLYVSLYKYVQNSYCLNF